MKSSTKFFILFIFLAAIAAFVTFYPNILTLLPFKFPYVANKVEAIIQWGAYVTTIQTLIIAIVLKIKKY